MAAQTLLQASIAELYDEAEQARELASEFHDAAVRADLVNYAAALEAVAARWGRAMISNAKGGTPDWEGGSSGPGDRAPPLPGHPHRWGSIRRGQRM